MADIPQIGIAIIGCGNVATVLAVACAEARLNILAVFGRDIKKASVLVESIKKHNPSSEAVAVDDLAQIPSSTDLALISVSDRAIAEVASKLQHVRGIVAHTAGAVDITALGGHKGGSGVIYPLQTFTASRHISLTDVPFFIEGDSPVTQSRLIAFASCLTRKVRQCDSLDRRRVHLAGVWACNFVNAILGIAASRLESASVSSDDLKPIVMETVDKFLAMGEIKAQTGPAARGDREVLDSHLKLIDNPRLRDIYNDISAYIFDKHNKNNYLNE